MGRIDKHKAALTVILACYLCVGFLYSIASPTFEASDELRHYLYVKQLAKRGGLPVLGDLDTNPAAQEASQPPLYYLIMAAATSWIATEPIETTYKANPHATIGRPSATTNKNVVIHGPEENFPWRGDVLAVRVIRWLSLVLGAATILITYALGRKLLPEKPHVALLAAAANAFVPGFLFIAASVNNDNLVTLLGSLSLLVGLSLAKPDPSKRSLILFGLLAGMASIAKLSGAATLPLGAAALAIATLREKSARLFCYRFAIVLGIAVLVAGWWYARNWLLYADVLGMQTMAEFAGSRPASFSLADLFQEQEGFRWSFWAVFGGFNIIADRWVYCVYDILVAAAAVGLFLTSVKHLVRRRGVDAQELLKRGLVLLWLLLLTAGLAKWSLSTMASQGRLLYPSIGVILLGLALGWDSFLPARWSSKGHYVVLAVLAALSVYLPVTRIAPTYKTAPLADPASVISSNPLMVNFDDQLLLMGYSVDRHAVQAGGAASVNLQWQTLGTMDDDYSVFVHVYGANGGIVTQTDSYPGGGAFATSALPLAVAFEDRHRLEVPRDATGQARIAVGLYRLRTGQMIPARDGQGRPLTGAIPLTEVDIVPRDDTGFAAAKTNGANLGGRLELSRVQVAGEAKAGNTLTGTIFWRPTAIITENYATFVHLLGPEGIVAQFDGQPVKATYPTSQWRPGDIVPDEFNLRLAGIGAGSYRLVAGLYDQKTGRRLTVDLNPAERLLRRLRGQVPAVEAQDSVILAVIHVQE